MFGYNTNDGDGCSSTCDIESGWTWSGGSQTSKDTCLEIWGDGIRFNINSTYWDDGDNKNRDGCSSTWDVETGFSWTGGSSTSKDTCSEICGDSKRINTLSTKCDDGNTANNDGWSSTWNVETGWTWTGGSSTTKDTCSEICGDSKRFNTLSTKCDDGNTANNDGCSSTWNVETGWTWTGGSSTTKDTCSEICGDSKRFNTLTTSWEDGNTANSDGWSSTWSVETGWTWSGGSSTTKDTSSEICGDSKRFNTLTTSWEDGNTANNDGCSSTWDVETGWTWSGGSSTTKDTCSEICGDSKRFNTLTTYWDDGNTSSNDGCNSTWSVETGWTWTGGSSTSKDTCSEICGDSKRFNTLSTICDDGNTANNDGWSSTWNVETGWSWSGGSSSSKDTCLEITSLQIVVEFDQVMFNQNITLFDMDLNILGPNSPYVSSWTSKYDKNKLMITFSSSPSLLGGIGEEIILLLYNVNVFKNENDNNIWIESLNWYSIWV